MTERVCGMTRFLCEGCGKTIKAPDEYAGRKCKCPRCEEIMIIPVTRPVDPVEESELVPARVTSMSEHKARGTIPKKPQPTTDPAAKEAASRVRFAKMYLLSGKKKKAVPILKQVIEKHPETQAAVEAHTELEKLGKE